MIKTKLIVVTAIIITILINISLAYCYTFDFTAKPNGEKLDNAKKNLDTPVTGTTDKNIPFYLKNDSLKPVFRVKFDEGDGNEVTESVSGNKGQIIGDDFEWINNADIRYGSTLPLNIRQKSALRLNNSYINLGSFDNLNVSNEMTLVFWTNYEVFGRNENYVEPAYQTTLASGSYKTAYKYDRTRRNVIFQSDNSKFYTLGQQFSIDGITNTYDQRIMLNSILINNDYYNMYIIEIRKSDDGTWQAYSYANDKHSSCSTKTLSSWGKNIFAGNVYIGTPNPSGDYASMQLGLADMMVFNRALSYQERLELYYGYKQISYFYSDVPIE